MVSGSDVVPSGQRLLDTPDLLDQIRNGDSEAYNELFDRYSAQLESFVRARLPSSTDNTPDVAELVQEVSIRILPFLDRIEYSGVGSFWTCLRETALVCIDEVWRDAAERLAPSARGSQPSNGATNAPAAPDRSGDHTEAGQLLRSQLVPFESVLAGLPDRSRNAFLMRLELGLDYQSIAEECDFPTAAAARQDISRTIETLGRKMADNAA